MILEATDGQVVRHDRNTCPLILSYRRLLRAYGPTDDRIVVRCDHCCRTDRPAETTTKEEA